MPDNTYANPNFNIGRNTARAIVIHDGKMLLMERWRKQEHYFSIPGGGIEEGEIPEQTVLRELKEETSIIASIKNLIYTWEEGTHIHYFYECSYVSGEAHLPNDAEEAGDSNNRYKPRWIKLDDLKDLPYGYWEPVARQLIQDLSENLPIVPKFINK